MENHSLARMATDVLAKGITAQQDELVRKAIDFKMGRTDWTHGEVERRGEVRLHPNATVFIFDGQEMLAFYGYSVRKDGARSVVTQAYQVLCPQFEKHLNDTQPTGGF